MVFESCFRHGADVGIFRLRGPTHFVRRPAPLKMTGVLDATSARVELVPFPISPESTLITGAEAPPRFHTLDAALEGLLFHG